MTYETAYAAAWADMARREGHRACLPVSDRDRSKGASGQVHGMLPCVIDGVWYPSQKAAAEALGKHSSAISKMIAEKMG